MYGYSRNTQTYFISPQYNFLFSYKVKKIQESILRLLTELQSSSQYETELSIQKYITFINTMDFHKRGKGNSLENSHYIISEQLDLYMYKSESQIVSHFIYINYLKIII